MRGCVFRLTKVAQAACLCVTQHLGIVASFTHSNQTCYAQTTTEARRNRSAIIYTLPQGTPSGFHRDSLSCCGKIFTERSESSLCRRASVVIYLIV